MGFYCYRRGNSRTLSCSKWQPMWIRNAQIVSCLLNHGEKWKSGGWQNKNSSVLSPCPLTRLSGSRGSWPRNKSRIGPFPSGFGWKLVIKSGTTPGGDTGEEPNWVCKEGHIRDISQVHVVCLLKSPKRPPLSGQFGVLLGIGLFFSW